MAFLVPNLSQNTGLLPKLRRENALISVLEEIFSKIDKRPVFNKGVLGGKMLKNNKNVLDYYSKR